MSEPTDGDRKCARDYALTKHGSVWGPDGWKHNASDEQVEASLEDFAAGRADAIEELASEVKCRSHAAYAKVMDFESGTLDEAAHVAAGLFLRELAEDLCSDKWQRHYYAKRGRLRGKLLPQEK